MKKFMFVFLFLASMLLAQSVLADTYLYGYMPGGALGGGLRFDLKPGVVADISATGGSGSSGSTYSIYGDVFWGNWGVGVLAKKVSVAADLAYDLSLQYALEQSFTDKIAAGIVLTLINYDTTSGADPNVTVLPSIAPYFVLGL